jgi:hypothetical protein
MNIQLLIIDNQNTLFTHDSLSLYTAAPPRWNADHTPITQLVLKSGAPIFCNSRLASQSLSELRTLLGRVLNQANQTIAQAR